MHTKVLIFMSYHFSNMFLTGEEKAALCIEVPFFFCKFVSIWNNTHKTVSSSIKNNWSVHCNEHGQKAGTQHWENSAGSWASCSLSLRGYILSELGPCGLEKWEAVGTMISTNKNTSHRQRLEQGQWWMKAREHVGLDSERLN